MTQVTPIRDLKAYLEPEQVERLIAVATNPSDGAAKGCQPSPSCYIL